MTIHLEGDLCAKIAGDSAGKRPKGQLPNHSQEEAIMDGGPTNRLQDELSIMSDAFAQLGIRLTQIAEELFAGGSPPAETVIEELMTSRKSFAELRDRAVELAGRLPTGAGRPSEEIRTLKELEFLLSSIKEAEEKRADQERLAGRALDILDQVLSLSHRSGEEFPPLAGCHAKARELRQTIADIQGQAGSPDIAALLKGNHPLAELHELAYRGDQLDDERWAALERGVAHAFGEALSLAAARGKLLPTGAGAQEG
jgi:hypothetical protein